MGIRLVIDTNTDYIKELLRNAILKVTFNKVNGDERIMNCTLCREIIPTEQQEERKKNLNIDSTTIRVWDTDKNDWRSFILENVIEIETP